MKSIKDLDPQRVRRKRVAGEILVDLDTCFLKMIRRPSHVIDHVMRS